MMLRSWLFICVTGCVLATACTAGTGSSSKSGPSGSVDAGSNDGGAGGEGASGEDGGTSGAAQLPEGKLLYVRSDRAGNDVHDVIIARDLDSGEERVVTDLTGDGSSGWEIWGYSISPDRRRIAISSLYGPTKEDTATGLATRAIWTLATDGTDFRRLTPTFPNRSGGRSGYQIDVGGPMWTADGAKIVFDFGEYWWEGTTFKGGSFPWSVSAGGGENPSSVPTTTSCTVLHPSRNPATGEMLFIHSVCIPGSGTSGLFLYPAEGSTNPKQVLASSHVSGGVDVFLEKASWFADGSGFLFIGSTEDTGWTPRLLAYDIAKGTATPIVTAPSGSSVRSVAVSPDGSKIVYCLQNADGVTRDLHLIDVSKANPSDVAITNDGKSCSPSF